MLMPLVRPTTALAQEESQPVNGCVTCHENLYYLHDTGKNFCLCAEEMTCTCCHGGNPQTHDETEAHQGMELYPVEGENQVCQNCHLSDSSDRIQEFVNVAGVDPFHSQASAKVASLAEAEVGQPVINQQVRSLEPWQTIALTLVGLSFVVLMVLGYRCYRLDCLSKRKNH